MESGCVWRTFIWLQPGCPSWRRSAFCINGQRSQYLHIMYFHVFYWEMLQLRWRCQVVLRLIAWFWWQQKAFNNVHLTLIQWSHMFSIIQLTVTDRITLSAIYTDSSSKLFHHWFDSQHTWAWKLMKSRFFFFVLEICFPLSLKLFSKLLLLTYKVMHVEKLHHTCMWSHYFRRSTAFSHTRSSGCGWLLRSTQSSPPSFSSRVSSWPMRWSPRNNNQ